MHDLQLKPVILSKKVLLIRFSSIGDIVLTSPVIRCLKLQTKAEIHYLTKKGFQSILIPNPYISKVYTIEKKVGEVLPDLRKEQYDYIIDLHHNLRTALVKIQLPFVKSYSFKKLNFEKWLLVNFKINRLPQKHIVDRYLDTVRPLGVVNDGEGLDFFLADDFFHPPTPASGGETSVVNNILLNEYIAFPIGAGLATKALTVKKIVKICQSINYPIVLLGGQQEMAKSQFIEKEIINKKNILNLVGKCRLTESALVVKNAKVVVTGDTGLMHIAAAFRKPIVSIWGNTVPEFGMYPYYPKGMDLHTIIEYKELACRPCSKIGFSDCPKGHFKCIEQLNMLEVIAQIRSIIGD